MRSRTMHVAFLHDPRVEAPAARESTSGLILLSLSTINQPTWAMDGQDSEHGTDAALRNTRPPRHVGDVDPVDHVDIDKSRPVAMATLTAIASRRGGQTL
jgi:hypothetical protein